MSAVVIMTSSSIRNYFGSFWRYATGNFWSRRIHL